MYLAVEVQQVERKEAHADFDVFDFDVFAFAPAKLLERHEFASGAVDGDSFRVENEGIGTHLDTLRFEH